MSSVLRLSLLLSLMACASAAPPSISSGPDAELSFDGLHRVKNAQFAGVWIRTDVDFSVYSKLMVLPPEIAYKKPDGRDADEGFPLDERQMDKLRELFRDAFRAEIVDKGGWQVVSEAGPDVLLAQAGLIDLVVRVPPRRSASARGGTWVSSYGAMTLVVQLYDSQTRRILARVVDRLEVLPSAGLEFSQVDMSASMELRTFFQKWAQRLREGLDAVRSRSQP